MNHISIIDLGTGCIRNTVYDRGGEILGFSKKDNPVIHPRPGWAEQDPAYWWTAVTETFQDFSPEIRKGIKAISATSQREGIVATDENFEPLGNIIIWLDGRTDSIGKEIAEELGEEAIYDITGLVANPAWSLAKICWIKRMSEDIYRKTYKFLQAEDYLLSRLSGKAVTEFSIASRTCMLDVHHKRWSEEILKRFHIDPALLPELCEPGTCIGKILPDIAGELGLPTDVLVYTGAGDQQAAAVGVGALEQGIVSIGIGTSSALSMTLDNPVKDPERRIILNCAALPGKWEYEPPIWNTGALLKWFSKGILSEHESYDSLNREAARIPAGSEGLIAIPYFSGAGSPRWNPAVKGGFYGLALHHNHYHLQRALMESIAFEIKYNIDAMRASGIPLKQVILSGGASQNQPLCQIIADVLQASVSVSKETEASSRGVFFLLMKNLEKEEPEKEKSRWKPRTSELFPDPSKKEIYESVYKQYIELGNKLEELKF